MFRRTYFTIINNKTSVIKQNKVPQKIAFCHWTIAGETVDCGLTENMIAYLFQGSFKKQLKFNQFVNSCKETVFTLTLEPVPPENVHPPPSGTRADWTTIIM